MKKSTKIFVFAISLALLLGAAIGLSANAESTAPEIVSKNINVNGNYCLMLAVDPATVAGDDVTVTIYDGDPSNGGKVVGDPLVKAATATQKIDLDGDGTAEFDAIVFTTGGVSAKDIADVWYITTTSGGITSEPITYSVREYLFERLYKNGTVFATSEADGKAYLQKQFYLEIIDVATKAQQLLVNRPIINAGGTSEDLEKLVEDYTYVYVQGGSYIAGDVTANRGFVDENTSITLTTTGAAPDYWNVITFDKDGNMSSETPINYGETVTVSGNIVIIPYTKGVTAGKYFAEIGNSMLNFDSIGWGNYATYYKHTKFTTDTVGTMGWAASGDATQGKALKLTKLVNTTPFIHMPVTGEAGANCLVFEADIMLEAGQAAYTSTEQVNKLFAGFSIYWNKAGFDSVNSVNDMNKAVPGSAGNILSHINLYDNDGQYDESGNGGDAIRESHDKLGEFDIPKGEFHNICYEVYTDVKVIKFYVDGTFVCEWTSDFDVSAADINTVSFSFNYRLADVIFWFDDLYSGKIAKEYVAP
ncbi:MAG: hypothetical protein J6D20_08150 [Clostridia bacterium]|nr:hypothetical protein [Clostridia bacterium]